MRPKSTHLSLIALAIALGLLGTVSFVGAGDKRPPALSPPGAQETPALLEPATARPADARASGERPSSLLVHPLIGTTRAALEVRLGAPAESYVSDRFSFLTYRNGIDRYQLVLDDDIVVEVSRIN